MKKTILITGGAGFIGSHLASRLLHEDNVVIIMDNLCTGSRQNIDALLSNDRCVFIEQDVTQITNSPPTQLAGRHIDQIYHLASPASPNHHSPISYHALPMQTMLVNTTGTLHLLELAHKNSAQFLFASTSEAYGDPELNPQPETYNGNVSSTGPRSVYDESKRFGETLTAFFFRSKQVDTRIVRIFNTYGPHMSRLDKRMIVNFIDQALRGQEITIFGDGSQTRSLCYVDDTVEGLVRLMNTPQASGQVVNIGSPEEHTVLEFAQMVKRLTSSASEIRQAEKLPTDDPKKRRADISKAQTLLGWSPHINLEEGLLKTIEYMKRNTL